MPADKTTAPVALVDLASSCTRKKRYDTEQLANDVALRCWDERRVWLRAYACSACGGWHLTRSKAPPKMKPGWRHPEPSKQTKARARRLQRKRSRS